MNRLEFLQDTIDYYSVNPIERRCKTTDRVKMKNCMYSPKNAGKPLSQGCAIGRHLTEELQLRFDSYDRGSVSNDRIFNDLPQELQVLGKSFLQDVQCLHDNDDYWNNEGLNNEGLERIAFIKEYIQSGRYDSIP